MTADARFSLIFPRKLTNAIFSPFDLCNIVRPSQQQLGCCFFIIIITIIIINNNYSSR